MTYHQRIAAERKRISDCVDSYLLALFAPGNPRKQASELQRKYAREWYRRKAK